MPLKTDNLLSLCKTSSTGETTFRIKNVILFHWSLGKKKSQPLLWQRFWSFGSCVSLNARACHMDVDLTPLMGRPAPCD